MQKEKLDGADQPRGAQSQRSRGSHKILRKRVRLPQVKTGRSRGHISRHLTDGYVDLALMVYDSEEDEEAKLVGDGPAIHHFGIEVDDRRSFIEKIVANGGTLLSKPDSGTVKFRSPDGTIAEIVDVGRYEKMRE
jgi:lactoylglutathione lyase